MARAKLLEDRHVEYLRGHIGAFINTHPNPSLKKGATFLEESFEIWSLRTPELPSTPPTAVDLSNFLSNTGRWHHQISQNDNPVGYALSGQATKFGASWSLQGVFVSDLAKKVARAIGRIDRDRPEDDIQAHYVVVPSHKVVLFFLRGPSRDEVYVVESTGLRSGLEEGKFYSPTDLLRWLSVVGRVDGLSLNQIKRRKTSGKIRKGRSMLSPSP
jgi:hypothetical protein